MSSVTHSCTQTICDPLSTSEWPPCGRTEWNITSSLANLAHCARLYGHKYISHLSYCDNSCPVHTETCDLISLPRLNLKRLWLTSNQQSMTQLTQHDFWVLPVRSDATFTLDTEECYLEPESWGGKPDYWEAHPAVRKPKAMEWWHGGPPLARPSLPLLSMQAPGMSVNEPSDGSSPQPIRPLQLRSQTMQGKPCPLRPFWIPASDIPCIWYNGGDFMDSLWDRLLHSKRNRNAGHTPHSKPFLFRRVKP